MDLVVSDSPVTVRAFRTHRLSIPVDRTMTNGRWTFTGLEHVLLELDAGDAVGIGHAFAFEPRQADAIRLLAVDLAEQVLGEAITDPSHLWDVLWQRLTYIGHAGPPIMALAMIDTAVWDLLAQRAELPLFRLLGGERTSLPAYATGGWMSYGVEDLAEEAGALAATGFADYKLKVGHPDWRTDLDRVAGLRERVPGVRLMVDANQGWSVEDAVAAGRALGDSGVTWLEEPVLAEDLAGNARVTAEVDVPVVVGESAYTRYGFAALIERGAGDVLMPDLGRCGGPTEFMRVAALGAEAGLPISSHAFTEVSAHLMAACPNAGLVEHVPGWSDVLFDGEPVVRAGAVHLSEEPGLGLRFSERALREYGVEASA